MTSSPDHVAEFLHTAGRLPWGYLMGSKGQGRIELLAERVLGPYKGASDMLETNGNSAAIRSVSTLMRFQTKYKKTSESSIKDKVRKQETSIYINTVSIRWKNRERDYALFVLVVAA